MSGTRLILPPKIYQLISTQQAVVLLLEDRHPPLLPDQHQHPLPDPLQRFLRHQPRNSVMLTGTALLISWIFNCFQILSVNPRVKRDLTQMPISITITLSISLTSRSSPIILVNKNIIS